MKPHIKLSRGYWLWTVKTVIGGDVDLSGEKWVAACRFTEDRNRKEGRWPWSMSA